MNTLDFSILICGMNDETYSDQIMICKPYLSIKWSFDTETLEELKIYIISDLINYIMATEVSKAALGDWGHKNAKYLSTYVKHKDYLLGIEENKVIADLFNYFNAAYLHFAIFQVSGASIRNEEGYRFSVYSNEEKHKNLPHVHVAKDNISVRYSLETLDPIDPLVKPHKHDNKKIIRPFLEENKNKLFEMWHHSINGYTTPEITENGRQFYSES